MNKIMRDVRKFILDREQSRQLHRLGEVYAASLACDILEIYAQPLADAQAQLEAVRRERDEVVRIACGRSAALDAEREKYEKQCAGTKSKLGRIQSLQQQLDAERLKADTYMKSSAEWFIANKYTQQQLDAERTRREQVEMANYAKDGQIETLQAQLTQLQGLVGEIKGAFDYQIHNCERCGADDPLNTCDIYQTVVEAATLEAAPVYGKCQNCPSTDEHCQAVRAQGKLACCPECRHLAPAAGGQG